ncbi:hypothetical protein WN48_08377 [Eufriesea mexicana]|nr:hypothetical protein WN48_08377 [Eufriesea mexicana]
MRIGTAISISQCRNYTEKRRAGKWNVRNDGMTMRIKAREAMEREMDSRRLSLPINFAWRKKKGRAKRKENGREEESRADSWVTFRKSKTGDECRICRKSIAPEEASRICCECQHKICEDCTCYSTTTNSDDQSSWRCSVCRRKLASRDQPIVTQESTDSLLEVPVLEALQRRHSDARLGCQSGTQIGGLGTGLAPPRSPELRRHSDVSPASLKELEKTLLQQFLELLIPPSLSTEFEFNDTVLYGTTARLLLKNYIVVACINF